MKPTSPAPVSSSDLLTFEYPLKIIPYTAVTNPTMLISLVLYMP